MAGATATLGAQIRQARELRGLSLADVAATTLLALVITGCGQGGGTGAAECELQVRTANGRIYQSDGFTEAVGKPLGKADLAQCGDTGSDAPGPYFPDDPERVDVFSIPFESQGDRIALCLDGDQCHVMTYTGNL